MNLAFGIPQLTCVVAYIYVHIYTSNALFSRQNGDGHAHESDAFVLLEPWHAVQHHQWFPGPSGGHSGGRVAPESADEPVPAVLLQPGSAMNQWRFSNG
jgi:hypothetical protein